MIKGLIFAIAPVIMIIGMMAWGYTGYQMGHDIGYKEGEICELAKSNRALAIRLNQLPYEYESAIDKYCSSAEAAEYHQRKK